MSRLATDFYHKLIEGKVRTYPGISREAKAHLYLCMRKGGFISYSQNRKGMYSVHYRLNIKDVSWATYPKFRFGLDKVEGEVNV